MILSLAAGENIHLQPGMLIVFIQAQGLHGARDATSSWFYWTAISSFIKD
ncbi:MAG: hypothetical protein PHQ40_03535 [Anaerolineaceae bacterium]|nr:hypothetical protein [Anaerolineaceae bacterium]